MGEEASGRCTHLRGVPEVSGVIWVLLPPSDELGSASWLPKEENPWDSSTADLRVGAGLVPSTARGGTRDAPPCPPRRERVRLIAAHSQWQGVCI